MAYRETFKKLDPAVMFSKMTPAQAQSRRRARQLVWKIFRLKLAKHLMAYLPQLGIAQ